MRDPAIVCQNSGLFVFFCFLNGFAILFWGRLCFLFWFLLVFSILFTCPWVQRLQLDSQALAMARRSLSLGSERTRERSASLWKRGREREPRLWLREGERGLLFFEKGRERSLTVSLPFPSKKKENSFALWKRDVFLSVLERQSALSLSLRMSERALSLREREIEKTFPLRENAKAFCVFQKKGELCHCPREREGESLQERELPFFAWERERDLFLCVRIIKSALSEREWDLWHFVWERERQRDISHFFESAPSERESSGSSWDR